MLRLNFILGSNNLFYFRLFQTHYHILPYPKTKENIILTRDKIEPQHIETYISDWICQNVAKEISSPVLKFDV